MPFYDFRCPSCEGIFERMLPMARLHSAISCQYCQAELNAIPIPSGSARVRVTESWRPSSTVEQLTGKKAHGPGAASGARRSNVLHVCKGSDCSLCGA